MTVKIITLCLSLISGFSLYAQDYAQWPADKPETGFIENSKSREIRLRNSVLPQEVDMQDKMRVLITDMMQNASNQLGWTMIELSEYTNQNPMQGAGTPYALRSPRGIEITFQFIVNKDSLQAWKNYQSDYANNTMNTLEANYNNTQSVVESPKYKQYRDSANYYMNLYTTYCDAHKDEGVDLYTKDKHPKYYQQMERGFIDKANAMVQQAQDKSGVESLQDKGKNETRRYRNHTVVQVTFHVNDYVGLALNQSLGPIEFTSATYPISDAKISRLYSISRNQDHNDFDKWNNVIMILLGNFQTKPDKYFSYNTGFDLNGQGDEHTPKKIKSDKVQNISINICGDKTNIEKMAKLVDVAKLNSVIVKK